MDRDNHRKLKSSSIASVKDADNLLQQLLDNAKKRKMCGIELSNPEFFGLATQELKIILNVALE